MAGSSRWHLFRIWQRDNDKPALPPSTDRSGRHCKGIGRLLGLCGTLPIIQETLEAKEEAKAEIDVAKVACRAYSLSIEEAKKEVEANTKRIAEFQSRLASIEATFGSTGELQITDERAQTRAEVRKAQTLLYSNEQSFVTSYEYSLRIRSSVTSAALAETLKR